MSAKHSPRDAPRLCVVCTASPLSHIHDLLAKGAGVWAWTLDCATGGFDVHGDLTPLLGRNVDTLDDFLTLVHTDDAGAVTEKLSRAMDEGAPGELECRVRGGAGDWLHLHASYRTQPHPSGRHILHGIALNVPPVAERREALQEANRLAKRAEALAGVGYWRADVRTGGYVWSEQMYRIYGIDPAIGPPNMATTASDYCHPDDRERLQRHRLANANQDGAEIEVRIVRPDGEIRHMLVRSAPERDGTGQIVARFGTLTDVTDIRRAEAAAKESEQRYRFLAENAPDMICRLSISGEIRYVSPSSIRVFGYTPEEMTRQNPAEMVHPEDTLLVTDAIMRLVRDRLPRLPKPLCYRAKHKNGHWIWVESNPDLIFDNLGQPVETIDILRDVTQAKVFEAELNDARERAEAAAAAKSAFLANMSHELRTPLTSIIGFSRLLREQEGLQDKAKHYATRISDAGGALFAVVNDILDFSKLEAGKVQLEIQPMSVRHLVEETMGLIEVQAAAKEIELKANLAPSVPEFIAGDLARLRQVLLNLLSNAVKFTDRGSIAVKASYRRSKKGDRLRLTVTDTGQGIPPEKVGDLFERFSQAEVSIARTHGGTGLGLAISKGIVELMGGEIAVNTTPGHGSTFWFEIPTEPATIQTFADADANAPTACPPLRILVVDDAAANRELVKLMLEPIGVTVEEATGGAEGVHAALTEAFDLILMDVRMPGVDGLEATRMIRAASTVNGRIPILALTADVQPENAAACRSAGMTDVLAKPIVPRQLLSKIMEWGCQVKATIRPSGKLRAL